MNRILMIEDDGGLAASVAEAIKLRAGANITLATTVAQAIVHLREDDHFDLILCDWELPDGLGPQALQWVQDEGTKVIVWSGLDRTRELATAFPDVRADHVLTKDASMEALTLICELLGVACH